MQKNKTKLSAILLTLLLMLSVTANAQGIMPRWNATGYCTPVLSFSGTTATCIADIWADSDAEISGTMTLYRVSGGRDYYVSSWSLSGTSSVYKKGTCSVTKGETYRLVVDVTVSGSNGTDNISVNTSKTCK